MFYRSKLVMTFAALGMLSASTLALAQTEPAATEGTAPPPRFQALADGTVRDNATGLLWADKDNGGDVNWAGAQAYCVGLGSGWSLPGTDELLGLYDAAAADGQPCIGLLTCKVTPLIRLSGLTPWSRESNGDSEAWYVYFTDGQKYSYNVANTQGKRALCVKSS